MTRWNHIITFNTEGLTLVEWYQSELPKYIKKYENNPELKIPIAEAKAIIKTVNELFPNGVSRL